MLKVGRVSRIAANYLQIGNIYFSKINCGRFKRDFIKTNSMEGLLWIRNFASTLHLISMDLYIGSKMFAQINIFPNCSVYFEREEENLSIMIGHCKSFSHSVQSIKKNAKNLLKKYYNCETRFIKQKPEGKYAEIIAKLHELSDKIDSLQNTGYQPSPKSKTIRLNDLPPPPPSKSDSIYKASKKLKKIQPTETKDLRKDLFSELRFQFDGKIDSVKPSDVIKISKPKHYTIGNR